MRGTYWPAYFRARVQDGGRGYEGMYGRNTPIHRILASVCGARETILGGGGGRMECITNRCEMMLSFAFCWVRGGFSFRDFWWVRVVFPGSRSMNK
jgi:hypothetical protein